MRPTYSAEAENYREKIRAFLRTNLPSDWEGVGALSPDERRAFVASWRATLAEHQLLAVAWPKEYGGAGLTDLEQVVISEEFARAGVPTGSPNDGFGIGMVGPTVMVCGTEEQKRYYLPRILDGTSQRRDGEIDVVTRQRHYRDIKSAEFAGTDVISVEGHADHAHLRRSKA